MRDRVANFLFGVALLVAVPATAQRATPSQAVTPQAKKDIDRHRAMATAHEEAAKCLESGTPEEACHKQLAVACKGLAIGKYCGMRHEH